MKWNGSEDKADAAMACGGEAGLGRIGKSAIGARVLCTNYEKLEKHSTGRRERTRRDGGNKDAEVDNGGSLGQD